MPVLNENQFHEFHILGNAAGTISIQEATLSTSDIIYSIKFNTGEQDLLKKVLFYNPPFDSGEIMAKKSSFVVVASRDDSGDRRLEAPLSYEIVITIPPHLQRLHVTAHSASRVKYLPKTNHKKSLPGIRVSIDKYDVQTTKSSDVLEAPQTPFRLSVDSSWFANEMLLVKRSQLFFSQASLPVQYQWGVISISAYSQKPSPSDASKGGSIPLSSGDSDKPPETTVFTVQGTAQGLITIKNIERKVTRTVRWDEVVEICTEDEHAYDANHWEPYNTKKARWHRLKSLFDK